MHWAYLYMKNITKFCPPRWYRYLLWPMDWMKSSTFSTLLVLCADNSPVSGEFPSLRPVTHRFDVFFLRRNKHWVTNREAGDLRHHRAHYDVIVMKWWVMRRRQYPFNQSLIPSHVRPSSAERDYGRSHAHASLSVLDNIPLHRFDIAVV